MPVSINTANKRVERNEKLIDKERKTAEGTRVRMWVRCSISDR
jgi:hypothetical protein